MKEIKIMRGERVLYIYIYIYFREFQLMTFTSNDNFLFRIKTSIGFLV